MKSCAWTPSLELEDTLVCENYNSLDKSYREHQNELNREFMYVPDYYKCTKNFEHENNVLFPASSRICDKEVVHFRGQNNVVQHINKKKDEFLLPYCKCNTYDNSLICDANKCCSKSHQLFMNMTKRHGVKEKKSVFQ